ncbi:hypothetical protein [Flavobacterium sp. UMI-01]|uniref:hypothetical protein n=1 Tax=Flavobacterium sp. UMI-01 TaxID=1441053 RepID=UPI001C7D60C5|nr:hypothetical protein [Flavobacterium sp. UMI-01]GIZ08381.1 hypothetical protein FUMI01_11080 [Flavobacterium sp. UMI-01]
MAYSKIRIEFITVPAENSVLQFTDTSFGTPLVMREVFKTTRTTSMQAKLPRKTGSFYHEYMPYNYRDAFVLDYNFFGYFTNVVTRGSTGTGTGSIEITATYPGAQFQLIEKPEGVNVVITNEDVAPIFEFVSAGYSTASSPQTHVRLNVETSVLATKIVSPVVANNTDNPFYLDLIRGSSGWLNLEDANGNDIGTFYKMPDVLDPANFSININATPFGGTVTITEKNITDLVLEYSLDNIDFQSENIFSGLLVDDYTLYIRDSYGAQIQMTFSITEFGIQTPYFYISESNSIRFANRVNWGDAANYKNDENTLGCEVEVGIPYCGCQRFKSANVITTQFKSNYETNTVTIIKEDGTAVNVPVVKKSNNIGVRDKRDAFKYSLGNGKVGIYFIEGNIYDYETNAITGTHTLNGTLPEWAIAGGYVNIGSAWFTIDEIYYDETKGADVIVYAENYSGAEISVVVGSIYNTFNFEIYEFVIDMVDYLNQKIQVKIENTDAVFEPVTHLSEKLEIAVNFPKNVEIYYWNDDNTDVFYATGIRHLINVALTKEEGVVDEESEAYKTDTTAILLSAQLHKMKKFTFEPQSEGIWWKMMVALSHKNVFINGVQYVKNGNFETEGALDDSNLYVLKATMLKTGIVYNADSATGDDFNTSSIEIPGLIETEIGFLEY